MPDPTTEGSGGITSSRTLTLPDVPLEDSLLHTVLEYRKQLDLALAAAMMLEVAQKKDDPRCATLLDFDLTPIIAAATMPGDRHYYSALQFRL